MREKEGEGILANLSNPNKVGVYVCLAGYIIFLFVPAMNMLHVFLLLLLLLLRKFQ